MRIKKNLGQVITTLTTKEEKQLVVDYKLTLVDGVVVAGRICCIFV
jgi:hypothetical protein